MSKYGVFSGPYFPVFGLNTVICLTNLCIQSENRKIRTIKNSGFGQFSRGGFESKLCRFSRVHEKFGIALENELDNNHISSIPFGKLYGFTTVP